MDSKSLAKIDSLLLTEVWAPIALPQRLAADSEADILGYGGAAGGGKSDLMLGLALTQHRRSIIYRREATQLLPVRDRIAEIVGGFDAWNGQDNRWNLPKRTIELAGVRDLGSERRYQGRAHDLKCFDEAVEMAPSQVRFLMGWLRSADPKQRCRVVMGFNPPTTEDGRWIVEFFAPWLDDTHPEPAEPGELRWFTTHPETGRDFECDGPEVIELAGESCTPLSRTFIPAQVEDNPFYMEAGYKAVLQALPEPLRSQMLKGDFSAGVQDDPWQLIPTEWVRQAQARWTPAHEGPMDAVGCDPARGGEDRTALCARYGTWFSEVDTYPGQATPDGSAGASLCVGLVRDQAPIHVDVIGIGSSVYDHLNGLNVHAVAVNVSKATTMTDKTKKLRMANERAAMWWRMRESLDPVNGDDIALPPDDELRRELCTPRFKIRPGGVYVESKPEVIARVGRSPDKAEAVLLASYRTLKRELHAREPVRAVADFNVFS